MSCDDRELEDLCESPALPKIEESTAVNNGESNENILNVDHFSDINFDKLNDGLTVKPHHWTDDYWETISNKYKWFIHKDGNAGCSICLVNKVFMGKRSLLATMKLRLMELSYSDFEKKLLDHVSTSQHIKSLSFYCKNPEAPTMTVKNFSSATPVKLHTPYHRKNLDIEYPCPMCCKTYKMKKVLARHIASCNFGSKTFQSPCDCGDFPLNSIRAISEHNQECHGCKFLLRCHYCTMQLDAVSLYEHFILIHNYLWNPFEFMPESVETDNLTNNNRVDRKKAYSKQDDIYYRYDEDGDMPMPEDNKIIKRRKIEKSEPPPINKIEKIINNENNATSHLVLALDQIHTCEFCGGRYLSANILNEHISTRHAFTEQNQENDENSLKRKYKDKLLAISESLFDTSLNHSEGKRSYTKRKPIAQSNITFPDNTISPCLLTCPLCQETFPSLENRNAHVSLHHPEIEQFVCHQCGLIFTNSSNYNKHVEKSHDNNIKTLKSADEAIYSCTSCPLVFTNTADLNHHVNLSHPNTVVMRPLTNQVDIDNEEVVENPNNFEKTIKTDILKLDEEHDANDDVKEQTENNSNKEEPNESINVTKIEETQIIENPLSALIEADYKENPSPCDICKSVLHNAFEKAVHILTHSEDGENNDLPTCPSCNRLFFGEFGKIYLKDHYNVDHLKKCAPHCIICNVTLPSSIALERHQVNGFCQMEAYEDPYQALLLENKFAYSCSQCGTIFAGENSNSRLEIHNRTCTADLMDDDEFLDT